KSTNGHKQLKSYQPDEQYPPHRKILREVLETELAEFGFQPHFPKAIGLIPPTIFREMLREGLLPKDPGAVGITKDNIHGEFAHAIQWFLIAKHHQKTKAFNDSDSKQFKQVTVIDLFKQLGEEERLLTPEHRSDKRKITTTDKIISLEGVL